MSSFHVSFMTNDGIVWYQIFVRAVLYPYDSRLYQQHISTNKQTHKNANDHDCPPAVVRLTVLYRLQPIWTTPNVKYIQWKLKFSLSRLRRHVGGIEVELHSLLNLVPCRWVVNFTFRPLYPSCRNPDTHWIGGCVGPGAGMEVLEDSNPGPPSP